MLRTDRRLTIQWTSLEVLREDMALRLKYRIQAEPSGSLTIDTNLFPYDPLHQTFINIYEDGSLRQQLIFNAGTSEYVYYAGTTQGALAVMRHLHPVGHPPHHDRARPHPVPRRAAAARRHVDDAAAHRHRLHDRPQHHAVAGGAERADAARDDHRTRHRAQHRLRGRRQPGARRRAATCAPGWRWSSGWCTASASPTCCASSGCRGEALGWSLFSFNFGVEIGQVAIVLLVASLLAAVRKRSAPDGNARRHRGIRRRDRGGRLLVRGAGLLSGGHHLMRVMLAAVVVVLAVAGALVAQQPPQFEPIGPIQKVRNNLFMIPGQGGNTAVFVTRRGVVLVDTKLAGQRPGDSGPRGVGHGHARDHHHQHAQPLRPRGQ